MMRYLRAVSIPAAIVLQFCAAVAAPQVGRPTEAVTKPSPQPSTAAARLISDTEIDARIRKEVLGKLASELESRYVIEDTAKRLAELVRAKQKSNAYRSITTGPALARALTDDLAVAIRTRSRCTSVT
ncbi:MAG: N-terminal domain of Peptidase in eukaryotic [Gammaproteobacteria bacterium]|nr:N-terminal domain of Peptidase in eukaryotic [Gammaproteobacteria bacterium]